MTLSTRLFLALSIAPLLTAQTKFETDLLAMSPLGFWPLYGNANDVSGQGNNGTLMNGVTFTGHVNPLGTADGPSAVFANAQDQFVEMPTAGSSIFNLGASHPLTAMAWIRTLGQGHMAIMSKFGTAAAGLSGWSLAVDSSGVLGLFFVVSGTPVMGTSSAVAVNDGTWHLVAATYDGSGTSSGWQLYVDGVGVTATAQGSVGGGSILNSGPLTIGAESDGSDAFDGYVNDAAVFGVVLTPAQILQLAEDASAAQSALGQFAFGGGWYSAVYFSNTNTSPVSFPVTFTADSGSPLTISSINGSSINIALPPGGSVVIQAPNQGPLMQGYVTAALPVGVTGYGVFRQSVPGIPDQEAVVPLAPANTTSLTIVYDDTAYTTAVAIVNPSSVATTVNIVAEDFNGNMLGTSSVMLPAYGKSEAALRSLSGLSQIAGNHGTAHFTVASGYVVVLGLRFNGSAFSSIPAVPYRQLSGFEGRF